MTPEEKQKAFADAYDKLCKEHGLTISFIPQWKQSADTGTWSMVIQAVLVEMKPQ